MYYILIFIILKKLESEIFESMAEVRIICLGTRTRLFTYFTSDDVWPYGTGGGSHVIIG